ncbi:MAG: hypothetical protein U9Q40_05385 [Campylobacterota bacterium]|nr:hypothetical protein [Campylobacterota bacterium]
MIKKILISSLCSGILLLSGCGDSEGEERLSVQQMLDKGDYTGVISKLEAGADSNVDYIALGAAYMGKAGVSLTNIVSAMASGDDTNDDGFVAFVKSIAGVSTATAISDLGKSADFYKKVVGSCTAPDLSDAAKDICLYIGLGATTRTAVTIDNLVGDISTFGGDTKDDKLTASLCAMQYAVNNEFTDEDCTIVEDANVEFATKSYTPLTITVNSADYYHLMINSQSVITDGYCAEDDFSSRVESYDISTAPYACPMSEDPTADELTTAGVLVEVLNEGMESVGVVDTEDIQEDVNEFKCEILGSTYNGIDDCTDPDVSIDTDISEEDIIDYLDAQNSGV